MAIWNKSMAKKNWFSSSGITKVIKVRGLCNAIPFLLGNTVFLLAAQISYFTTVKIYWIQR